MSDLRETLLAIRAQRGVLTPRLVLDEARDESHPLHDRFEWDDGVAGEKYRLNQAHELIRSVRIVYRRDPDQKVDVRAFHAIRRENGHVYEPAEEVVRDEVATRIILSDMEREWRQLQDRYGAFKEFVEMVRRDLADVA